MTLNLTGAVNGFTFGDDIHVTSSSAIASTRYQSTGTNVGTLTLSTNSAVIGSLTLVGGYTAYSFPVSANAGGGYDITLSSAPPAITPGTFSWTGTQDTSLANAGNWTIQSGNPAASTPGVNDTADLFTPTGTLSNTASVAITNLGSGSTFTLSSGGNLATAAFIDSGTFIINGIFSQTSASSPVGITAGAALTVNSGGVFTLAGIFTDGSSAAATLSTLKVQAGGVMRLTGAATTANYVFNVGYNQSTVATATVTGSGSQVDVGLNGASIGYGGTGSLTVSAGATMKSAASNSNILAALSVGIRARVSAP